MQPRNESVTIEAARGALQIKGPKQLTAPGKGVFAQSVFDERAADY